MLILQHPCPCASQTFRNLNADFPFAPSEAIFQDRDGFLWIGTTNGLVRYDGYTTQIYTHEPQDSNSIAGNNINAISQDSAGRMWIGLSAFGLVILDSEFHTFKRLCIPDASDPCILDLSVNAFAPDQDGTMWVGTESGLFHFSTDANPTMLSAYWQTRDTGSLKSSYIHQVFIDSRQRLWVGTAGGIHCFDRDQKTFVHYPLPLVYFSEQILDIGEDRHHNIWLSPRFTEHRLYVYDEHAKQFYPAADFQELKYGEFRFAFDHDNDLWIVSRGGGAFHVDAVTRHRTYFDPKHSKYHGYRNIYGLTNMVDRYGNVWITGGSLMQWPATHKVIRYCDTDHNPVISVYADSSRIWYCDNEPRRFNIHDGVSKTYWPSGYPTNIRQRLADSERPIRIYQMQDFGENHVIMTTTRNVLIWDLGNDAFTEYPLDYGGPFRDFLVTDDLAQIWICGNQGSPILLDFATGEYSRPEYASTIRNPRSVAKSKNGDLWFGSNTNGVYKLDAKTQAVTNFAPDHEIHTQRLTDYAVNDLVVDNTNRVWVGTNLGVNIIDPATNAISTLRKQEHFPNESIMSIIQDPEGDLWFGTQQGLVRYHPAGNTFMHLDRTDGLINTVYSAGACYSDRKGLLYFGGERGVDFIDPQRIGFNTIPPDLLISKILVNDALADSTLAPHHVRTLHLSHTQNFLEIQLLALHYTAPEANQYAYRIPEIDTSWRYLGTQRSITLANLQPGMYTLQARASNADGVWCEDTSLLHIRVNPPYWRTWWFIGLCIVVLTGGIYSVYRYQIHQIRTREKLKSTFNKRIIELESKALRAQMNPHFLFNSINSVKSLISQGANEKATQYLTQFGQLIRQVLANSEKSFVRLQEELEALRLYLSIEQLRFQNFNYTIQVDEHVNVDFIEVPPLILQPYVENAIWHGLMHKTEGERKLSVHVAQEEQYLEMVVEDNGIGRERAGQMKMRGDTRKGGMGMRLTTDRLNLLHQIYGSEVSVSIDDLHDDFQKPTGTRVRIRIPYSE